MASRSSSPSRQGRSPSPTRLVSVAQYITPSPMVRLHVKGAVPWRDGPSGRDTRYEFQKLGWPWARTEEGQDSFPLIRLSAIGDQSCYYHSLYKSIGILRAHLSAESPFLADDKFTSFLDYLDVDYRDPETLAVYVRSKTTDPTYLEDTYAHRQYLVDTWRNDLFRWLTQPAINSVVGTYYTEEEAIRILNNNPINMFEWMMVGILDPSNYQFETSRSQASSLLDLFFSAGRHLSPYQVYAQLTSEKRAGELYGNLAVNPATLYMSQRVVDNDVTTDLERVSRTPAQAWRQGLFSADRAEVFLHRVVGKDATTVLPRLIGQLHGQHNFREIMLANFAEKLADPIRKQEYTAYVWEGIFTEIEAGVPSWLVEAANLLPEAEQEAALTWTGDGSYSEPTVRLASAELQRRIDPMQIFAQADWISKWSYWGSLQPLMEANPDVPTLLWSIDAALTGEGRTHHQLKQSFSNHLTGPYVKLIHDYIDLRMKWIHEIRRRCGMDPDRHTHSRYSAAYLSQSLTDGEAGWELVRRSINPVTSQLFTEDEVLSLQQRDPRLIRINGIPNAALFSGRDSTTEVDPQMMAIPLNTNYYMMDNGFFLRSRVFDANIRFIREMLPVHQKSRRDAGEEILPWLSRLLGVNSHILRCYENFVWRYASYTSGDQNVELPNTPHIFINNTGGHYDVLALPPENAERVTGKELRTIFSSESPLVTAYRQFGEQAVISAPGRSTRAMRVEEFADYLTRNPPRYAANYPLVEITAVTTVRSPAVAPPALPILPPLPAIALPALVFPGAPALPTIPPLPNLPGLPPIPGLPLSGAVPSWESSPERPSLDQFVIDNQLGGVDLEDASMMYRAAYDHSPPRVEPIPNPPRGLPSRATIGSLPALDLSGLYANLPLPDEGGEDLPDLR